MIKVKIILATEKKELCYGFIVDKSLKQVLPVAFQIVKSIAVITKSLLISFHHEIEGINKEDACHQADEEFHKYFDWRNL